MFLASVGFNLLIAIGLFNMIAAAISLGAAVVMVRVLGNSFISFFGEVRQDLSRIRRYYQVIGRSSYRWFFYLLLFISLLTCLHATILPLLGWDTLTYHGVKAGMWVQNGGPTTMVAPGGWGHYRNFFGGGEALSAWAMLPFHNDLLAGFVEAVQWVLQGIALYALGKEFGIRIRYRWIGVGYALFIPALWLSVGSGYVEPGLNLALALGLLFAECFLTRKNGRFLLLSLMAFGVAGGIKITALPILAVVFVILFIYGITSISQQGGLWRWYAIGILAIVMTVGPWIARNIQRTGYPLAAMPVKVAGVTLGETTKTLEWYQDRPGLSSYTLWIEIRAIAGMFGKDWKVTPQLSMITLLPIFLFLVAFCKLLRRKKVVIVLIIGYIFATLVTIYHPGFSVVRIHWASVTGRFLLPIICPAVILSFWGIRSRSRAANVYAFILLLGLLFHFGRAFIYHWAWIERTAVLIEASIIFGVIVIVAYLSNTFPKASLRFGSMVIVPLLLLPPLQAYRDHTRDRVMAQSTVIHYVGKYWLPASKLVDTPGRFWKIAVTSGPYQNADNWFMYPFLGRKLQNQICYIPITTDGKIIDFGPEGARERAGNFEAWLRRLFDKDITHVMSFRPASLEMRWMEEQPEVFQRLEGDGVSWGLYQVDGM